MNIMPFGDALAAALTGESVFVYHMPSGVNRGILLLHNLGGATLDPNLPNYKKAGFQGIVRSTDYQSGYDLAKQVLDALTVSRENFGGLYIHYINPLHDPVAFPVSKGDYVEFSVNFETAYTEN